MSRPQARTAEPLLGAVSRPEVTAHSSPSAGSTVALGRETQRQRSVLPRAEVCVEHSFLCVLHCLQHTKPSPHSSKSLQGWGLEGMAQRRLQSGKDLLEHHFASDDGGTGPPARKFCSD